MSDTMDMQEARKRTLRLLQFEDGLWDILLGAVFLLLAVYPVTRALLGPVWNFVFFCGAMAALLAGAAWARVAVVIPRRGEAKPEFRVSRPIRVIFRLTLFLTLAGAVVWTLLATSALPRPPRPSAPAWLSSLGPDVLVALFLVLIFSLVARAAGVGRVYFYGWLLGLGNLASALLGYHAGTGFNFPQAGTAGIILIAGVVVLVRFLRRFPIPRPEP